MPKDEKKTIDNIMLSEDFKERAIKILPIAKDFVANKDPEDVLEYTKNMDPRDSYILGLVIGRILMKNG